MRNTTIAIIAIVAFLYAFSITAAAPAARNSNGLYCGDLDFEKCNGHYRKSMKCCEHTDDCKQWGQCKCKSTHCCSGKVVKPKEDSSEKPIGPDHEKYHARCGDIQTDKCGGKYNNKRCCTHSGKCGNYASIKCSSAQCCAGKVSGANDESKDCNHQCTGKRYKEPQRPQTTSKPAPSKSALVNTLNVPRPHMATPVPVLPPVAWYIPTPAVVPTPSQTAAATTSQTTSEMPSSTPSASSIPSQKLSTTPSQTTAARPTQTPSEIPSSFPSASTTSSQKPSTSPAQRAPVTQSQTPSRTPSQSPAVTPASTQSASTTPSMAPSNTPSQTAAATPSESPSETPASTPSASATPIMTPSTTLTKTAAETPSQTPSSTPSQTAAETPSQTPSSTPSASTIPSQKASTTPSQTAAETPSQTPSQTPSKTPSASTTPSMTASTTPSQTAAETPSQTPSQTPSSTPSVSITPSMTPSLTPSHTPTSTPSATPSRAPVSFSRMTAKVPNHLCPGADIKPRPEGLIWTDAMCIDPATPGASNHQNLDEYAMECTAVHCEAHHSNGCDQCKQGYQKNDYHMQCQKVPRGCIAHKGMTFCDQCQNGTQAVHFGCYRDIHGNPKTVTTCVSVLTGRVEYD